MNNGERRGKQWDGEACDQVNNFHERAVCFPIDAPVSERAATMDADTADASRAFPIARPVRDHVGYILDAENRQIGRASPEYACQIVHALNASGERGG